MLRLKANKKLIQDKLASTTGKVVLLKDLTNISSRMKSADTRNDMQESIRRLTEVYGKPISESTIQEILPHLPAPIVSYIGLSFP